MKSQILVKHKFYFQFFKILTVLFLFSSGYIFSQNKTSTTKNIDELLDKVSKLESEGKIDDILIDSKKIIQLSEKSKYQKGLVYGNFYLASYFYDNAKFKESIANLKKASQYRIYLASDKTQSSKITSLLGENYLLLELYTLSFKEFQKTLQIISEISKKSTENYLTESTTYSHLSYLYENKSMYDSMFYYLKQEQNILKKAEFQDATTEKGCSCLGLGNYQFNNKKLDSAEIYYKKSIDYFNTKKHPCKIESLIGLGDIYAEYKNYNKAEEYYNLAQKSFENNNFPDILSNLYEKMADLYISKEDPILAKKYQTLYLHLKKELEVRKKKERDFVLIDVMLEAKIQHENEVSKRQKITLFIFSVLLIITAFIIYLLKKSKAKNKKAEEFAQKLEFERVNQEKEKGILKLQVNDAFDEIITLAKENSSEFYTRFQEVYPNFSHKMLLINPKFRTTELSFCAYLYLGFSTKEIADYTFKAPKTIENNRYNLRKKLGITPELDLQVWLRNYIDSE